jgi:hypothetical protein
MSTKQIENYCIMTFDQLMTLYADYKPFSQIYPRRSVITPPARTCVWTSDVKETVFEVIFLGQTCRPLTRNESNYAVNIPDDEYSVTAVYGNVS